MNFGHWTDLSMIITLTTDFGTADGYVGCMKGVILGIVPEARVVDISHGVSSHDVLAGAFVLFSAARFFPPGTVHVAVVDPGVGSQRRPIAGSDGRSLFVGPDNGLLSLCLDEDGDLHHITNEEYFLDPVSTTFHGRDIFAPVAARLAMGAPLESVGPRIRDFLSLAPASDRPRVLHVDKFGNIVTSLRPDDLSPTSVVRLGGREIRKTHSSFSAAPSGELFLIVGSSGYVEVSMSQASAADRLRVRAGAELEVETPPSNQ